MAELHVIKTGFSACYDALKALSTEFRETSGFSLEESKDISLMRDSELKCYKELLNMMSILADLADETAQDVKLTQARYVLADQ